MAGIVARKLAAVVGATLLLAGCRAAGGPAPGPGAEVKRLLSGGVIDRDTVLEGTVEVSGECLVARGATLTLLPGTRLLFRFVDRDGDGTGESRLRVEGRVVARGTADEPVTFSSAGGPGGVCRPGDWDSLLFNFSRGNVFEYTVVEYSDHGFHAHFSDGLVRRSLIRLNNEGSRMGNAAFRVEDSLVTGNVSKGLNFRASSVLLRGNDITGNGNGLFIFEKDDGSVIEENNIHGNARHDLRLDDFFRGELVTGPNWWGSANEETVRQAIYDWRQDPDVGRAVIVPAAGPYPRPDGFPFAETQGAP